MKNKKSKRKPKQDKFIVVIAIANDKEENIYTLKDGKVIKTACWRKVKK